jgi:thiamine biosynthesis lipoprotein
MVVEDQVLILKGSPLEDANGVSYFQADGLTMGTTGRLVFSASSHAAAAGFCSQVSEWLHGFECRYSRYVDSSLICAINAAAGHHAVAIDEELVSMFKLCDWFHWTSQGLFDPTMLPLILLWDYQKESPKVPDPKAVLATRELIEWKAVKRKGTSVMLPREGMALDIGGIGKEYAVDRVLEMAVDAGIRNMMVDFGHDVRAIGSPPEGGPWRVGLEDPRDPGQCWSGVGVTGMAIATSGNYARGFEWHGKRYGHVLDPRTGYPVDNGCLSVSVVAPTCTEAGILSTVALILGADEFGKFLGASHQAEACMVTTEKTLRTPGFVRYELSHETLR